VPAVPPKPPRWLVVPGGVECGVVPVVDGVVVVEPKRELGVVVVLVVVPGGAAQFSVPGGQGCAATGGR